MLGRFRGGHIYQFELRRTPTLEDIAEMIESSEGPVAIVSFLLKDKWGGKYYWHRGHSPIMEIVKGFERFLVTDFSITNDFHLKIPEEEIKQSLAGGEHRYMLRPPRELLLLIMLGS